MRISILPSRVEEERGTLVSVQIVKLFLQLKNLILLVQ